MRSRDLYDSGAIEIHDGQGEEFQLSVQAREGSVSERCATATLTFGTGTMLCFATLSEGDLRRMASELAHAANLIRRYEEGLEVGATLTGSHRVGERKLTVVTET